MSDQSSSPVRSSSSRSMSTAKTIDKSAKSSSLPSSPSRDPFVEELRPSQVRWFYKNNLHERHWQPLNGRDSLSIEMAYRRHQASIHQQRRDQVAGDTDQQKHVAPSWTDTAIALGGLYVLAYDTDRKDANPSISSRAGKGRKSKVKSKKRATNQRLFPYCLKPAFWEGKSIHLTRGTWFVRAANMNWQPLDAIKPDLVQKVEEQHMITFANYRLPKRRLFLTRPFPQVICEVVDSAKPKKKAFSGVHVLWYGVDDILMFNYNLPSACCYYLKRPTGTKLIRGYHEEAREEDGPPPITDLIFVVHGLGQKWHGNTIARHVDTMREIADGLLRSSFSNVTARPLFFPVDWRSDLELDEKTVENITPDFLHPIRTFVNEALLDVMHFVSPVHGLKVARGLAAVLNRTYQTYIGHDPGFLRRNGRISIAAHNLGAVIVHDILSVGKDTKSEGMPSPKDRISLMPKADSKLTFKVNHLFCIGSPMGACMAIRQATAKQVMQPVGCTPGFRLHNIFHPADVLAYRVEPLISGVYRNVCPLKVHRCDAIFQKPYDRMPAQRLKRRPYVSPAVPKEETILNAMGFEARTRTISDEADAASKEFKVKAKKEEKAIAKAEKEHQSPSAYIPPHEQLPYRIDYELRMNRVVSAYWAAIKSHNSYWTNRDMVMYILSALYGTPKASLPLKKR